MKKTFERPFGKDTTGSSGSSSIRHDRGRRLGSEAKNFSERNREEQRLTQPTLDSSRNFTALRSLSVASRETPTILDSPSRFHEVGKQKLDATQNNPSSSNRGGRISDFATLQYQRPAEYSQEAERQRKELVSLERKNQLTGRTSNDTGTSAEKQMVSSNASHGKKGDVFNYNWAYKPYSYNYSYNYGGAYNRGSVVDSDFGVRRAATAVPGRAGVYGAGLGNGCVVNAVQMMLHDQGIYVSDHDVAEAVDHDPSDGASSTKMPGALNRFGNVPYTWVSNMDTSDLQERLKYGAIGVGMRRHNGNLHELVLDKVEKDGEDTYVYLRDPLKSSEPWKVRKADWDEIQAGGYIVPD